MTHTLKSKVQGAAGKFATLVQLKEAEGQYGKFLTNDIPRESVGQMDKYYVVINQKASEPSKSGKPKASHLLKVKRAGADKSEIVTGLFPSPSKFGPGEILTGTDQNSKITYMVVQTGK